jgi:hypothetical protein
LDVLSNDEVLDDAENPLLLMPGQFDCFFKNGAGFASGTALLLTAILPSGQIVQMGTKR